MDGNSSPPTLVNPRASARGGRTRSGYPRVLLTERISLGGVLIIDGTGRWSLLNNSNPKRNNDIPAKAVVNVLKRLNVPSVANKRRGEYREGV